MKIELKKIKFYEQLSEETNCFTADLYINGKKVGYVKNDGRGGCTEYYGYTKEDNEIIKKAETYCKTLPKVKYLEHEWEQTLENLINTLFEEYIIAKIKKQQEKKMQKLFQKAIVIGIPGDTKYRYVKFNRPLSNIPQPILQNYIDKICNTELKDGERILNTNLAQLGIVL